MRGSGRYARGDNALGICGRCSKKMLRRRMVYDGQYPDLLVCSSCWDPKHPQEYLPEVTDPVTILDPTGDPDRAQANRLAISFSGWNGFYSDLQVRLMVNQGYWSGNLTLPTGASGTAFLDDAFDIVAFDENAFSIGT